MYLLLVPCNDRAWAKEYCDAKEKWGGCEGENKEWFATNCKETCNKCWKHGNGEEIIWFCSFCHSSNLNNIFNTDLLYESLLLFLFLFGPNSNALSPFFVNKRSVLFCMLCYIFFAICNLRIVIYFYNPKHTPVCFCSKI